MYIAMALPMLLRFATLLIVFACSRARLRLGSRIEIKTAIMATTTRSSISVKPRVRSDDRMFIGKTPNNCRAQTAPVLPSEVDLDARECSSDIGWEQANPQPTVHRLRRFWGLHISPACHVVAAFRAAESSAILGRSARLQA